MARKHLVVVVPGIGGSVLEQSGKVLWDAGFGSVARLGLAAHRLSLAEAPVVRPAGLIRSRAVVPGWTVVCGYDRLMAALGGLPGAVVDDGHPDRRVPDANVVAFPYDFRASIVDAAERLAAEVTERLSALGGAGEPGRVIVVAHSMGGLVARYWMGPLGGWRVCRALITLGTPHRGAPKALNWVVGGVRLGGRVWQGATELFREWPSVTELLPRYPAIWDETAQAAAVPARAASGVAAPGSGESVRGSCRTSRRGGSRCRRPGRSSCRGSAGVMPPWMRRSGTGAGCGWSSRSPSWLSAPGWEKDCGDGTVPAVSALPVGLENWAVSVRRHPGAGAARAADLRPRDDRRRSCARIEDYEGRPRPVPGQLAYREAEDHAAAIGLDVDELHVGWRADPAAGAAARRSTLMSAVWRWPRSCGRSAGPAADGDRGCRRSRCGWPGMRPAGVSPGR